MNSISKHNELVSKHSELAGYFQDADHIDVKTIEGDVGLREFIAGMLSYYPWWIVALYSVRELLVNLLGLVKHEKPEILPVIAPETLAFIPGENASFFIVTAAKENAYWVAVTPEDKHLSAYLGVVAEDIGNRRTRYQVFTSVKYLHWTGPVYFNIIRPFHHLVVSNMMKAGVKGRSQK